MAETAGGHVPQGEQSKACSKCGVVRPLDDYSRNPRASDGRRYDCRLCCSARYAAWRQVNLDSERERGRRWCQENRAAKREYDRGRYRADPEAARERLKRYRQSDPESERERVRRNRLANLEARRASARKWAAGHPHVRAYHDGLRRARLMGATGNQPFTRAEIWERDSGRCHACGKLCDPKSWHLDHLIPLSRGGPNAPWNVAVAHPRCNLSRGNRGPAQPRLL